VKVTLTKTYNTPDYRAREGMTLALPESEVARLRTKRPDVLKEEAPTLESVRNDRMVASAPGRKGGKRGRGRA